MGLLIVMLLSGSNHAFAHTRSAADHAQAMTMQVRLLEQGNTTASQAQCHGQLCEYRSDLAAPSVSQDVPVLAKTEGTLPFRLTPLIL